MATTLTIGDFSKATFLSVKTLRHYHRVGLLEPAEVDETTGYRRYSTEQIPTAQVIRRFRDLDMPLDGIRAVIQAPDQPTRGQLIAAHLSRLEQDLAETQRAVAVLRDLIENPSPPAAIDHRQVPATAAAAVTTTVDVGIDWPGTTEPSVRSMPRSRRRASCQLPPPEEYTPTNCSPKSGAKLRFSSPPPGRSGLSAASVTCLCQRRSWP